MVASERSNRRLSHECNADQKEAGQRCSHQALRLTHQGLTERTGVMGSLTCLRAANKWLPANVNVDRAGCTSSSGSPYVPSSGGPSPHIRVLAGF